MHSKWPLYNIFQQFRRPELEYLKTQGYEFSDPYDIVDIFENKIASFFGAKYGIAVDCCSHGLFLCLKYLNASGTIRLPRYTYGSVPMQVEHAGCNFALTDEKWEGIYKLDPYPIWDAAALWKPNTFVDDFFVVSFQIKKMLCIGKGGMILTNNEDAKNWLKLVRYDGRTNIYDQEQGDFSCSGYHYYMTPEDAARGIIIFDNLPDIECVPSWKNYHNLDRYTYFKNKLIS